MSNRVSRRPLKFDGLPDTVQEVHRLHDLGYTMAGNWDLAKACQHLSKTMRMSIEVAPFSLPFFIKPVARWILFRSVMTGKPTRLPLKTAPAFRPDDAADPATEVAEYETLVEEIMAADAPLIPDHPVFGRITKVEWRTFHAWHAAHHLSFLIPDPAPRPSRSNESQSSDRPQTMQA